MWRCRKERLQWQRYRAIRISDFHSLFLFFHNDDKQTTTKNNDSNAPCNTPVSSVRVSTTSYFNGKLTRVVSLFHKTADRPHDCVSPRHCFAVNFLLSHSPILTVSRLTIAVTSAHSG